MKYYSQHFIDSIGEQILENRVFKSQYLPIDIDNLSFENVRMYYVFQHYLTKCIVTGKYSTTFQQYLNQMYQDFYKQPWKFVHSPLLNNAIIERVFGQNASKVKQFRDSYYSETTAKRLYKKSRTEQLTEAEQNQLYSFFIKNMNTKDESLQKVIKSEIKRIIDSNKSVRRLSDPELLFYCQYVANTTTIKPIILLGEESSIRGEEGNNVIIINHDIPGYSLAMLTKTVFHECQHAVQEEESKNKDTTAAFEMAQQHLFSRYMNNNHYNSYKVNYNYSPIELDAEDHGYYNAELFLCGEFQREDLRKELKQRRKEELDTRNYYAFMYNQRKIAVSVDKFVVENMDEIVKKHPEEMNSYPVLNHFYQTNGSKKSFLAILMQRTNQSQNRRMYECYLNYGIRHGELENIDLQNMSDKNIRSLIPALVTTYRLDNTCTLKDYFADTKTYQNSKHKEFTYKQIETTTNYKLLLATKLLSYINNNFDKIVSAYKGTTDERLGNTHPLYMFLYDFRDFNPDNIENEVLKTSPSFRKKLKEYHDIYKSVLTKFNKKYISQRLEELSESEKQQILTIGNIQITLNDFMTRYASERMDSHQKIKVGSKKINVGDIVYSLRTKEKNQQLKDMLKDQNNITSNDRVVYK